MKKILLIPTTLIVGLVPTISLVGCNCSGQPVDTEYDLKIIDSPHITVSPTKFKLNQELVIYYSCDDGYVIDETGSKITINDKVYSVSELPHDSSTVTLSKDKVNYEEITVNFLSLEEPGSVYEIYQKTEAFGEKMLQSDLAHMEVNKEVKFKIKWSTFLTLKSISDEEEGWLIAGINIISESESELFAPIFDKEKCHFFVDDNELKNNEIIVEEDNGTEIYPTKSLGLTDESVISGTIVASKIIHMIGQEKKEVEKADMHIIGSAL